MTKKPIKVKGVGGDTFAQSLRFSDYMAYQKTCSENEFLMVPMLLHLCIVNEAGGRVKTCDEWDEWCGGNFSASTDMFHECLDVVGSLDSSAKK